MPSAAIAETLNHRVIGAKVLDDQPPDPSWLSASGEGYELPHASGQCKAGHGTQCKPFLIQDRSTGGIFLLVPMLEERATTLD